MKQFLLVSLEGATVFAALTFKCTHLCPTHTVNKLRSLNLHFSSMLCIERKVVHVGAEKIITLYFFKFPSNLKILALLLMMRKITLEVKFDEKYVHLFKI